MNQGPECQTRESLLGREELPGNLEYMNALGQGEMGKHAGLLLCWVLCRELQGPGVLNPMAQ